MVPEWEKIPSPQSETNGYKSQGAVTLEDKRKAVNASLKYRMYAGESTRDWTIGQGKYDAHRQKICADRQPIRNCIARRANIPTSSI